MYSFSLVNAASTSFHIQPSDILPTPPLHYPIVFLLYEALEPAKLINSDKKKIKSVVYLRKGVGFDWKGAWGEYYYCPYLDYCNSYLSRASLVAQMAKNPGSIPVLGRPSGEGNGNSLKYSCLENLMSRGAWLATVHGVTKSWTWLSD